MSIASTKDHCHIVLYRKGDPIRYPKKADRQTAVFQWIITEVFCHKDRPLDILLFQYKVLIRTFRNFVLITESVQEQQLSQKLGIQQNICKLFNRVLVVTSI